MTARGPRTPRVETRRLSQLRAPTWWSELLGDLTQARRDVFDADVADRGIQQRPEILPDNTVIDGWLRHGSAGRSGQREIEVLVRYDLANASPRELELRALANALNGRHFTRLGLATLIYRMCELEAEETMTEDGWAAAVWAAAKDKIASFLGITLRSVNLYLRAIKAPKVVRDACDRKELTLTKTAAVGDLSDVVKTRISRRIRGNEQIRGNRRRVTVAEVVAKELRPARDTTSGFARLGRFAKSVDYHASKVRGHLRTLTPEQIRVYMRELCACNRLTGQLIARAS